MAKWNGFSLRWYQELLQNERILDALYYTIFIALVASVIATIVGTITAIGIHKMRKGKVRGLLLNINYLP
ncbi:ABC transporter permease, partial [Clostridium perfringens]